jgi:hypothetical protein
VATLNDAQLTFLRRKVAAKLTEVGYTKATAQLALQAIEDWFEGERSAINTAINTATSPITLDAGTKTILVAVYLLQKATREGA